MRHFIGILEKLDLVMPCPILEYFPKRCCQS
jgi:hypothetical protein